MGKMPEERRPNRLLKLEPSYSANVPDISLESLFHTRHRFSSVANRNSMSATRVLTAPVTTYFLWFLRVGFGFRGDATEDLFWGRPRAARRKVKDGTRAICWPLDFQSRECAPLLRPGKMSGEGDFVDTGDVVFGGLLEVARAKFIFCWNFERILFCVELQNIYFRKAYK